MKVQTCPMCHVEPKEIIIVKMVACQTSICPMFGKAFDPPVWNRIRVDAEKEAKP